MKSFLHDIVLCRRDFLTFLITIYQIGQLHKLLEKQQTLLEHEQQLRLTKIKPETKQLDGQPKKKHWWSFK